MPAMDCSELRIKAQRLPETQSGCPRCKQTARNANALPAVQKSFPRLKNAARSCKLVARDAKMFPATQRRCFQRKCVVSNANALWCGAKWLPHIHCNAIASKTSAPRSVAHDFPDNESICSAL